MEIKKQILALDRINESSIWDLVNPSTLGGPRFLPATWVSNMVVDGLRNAEPFVPLASDPSATVD